MCRYVPYLGTDLPKRQYKLDILYVGLKTMDPTIQLARRSSQQIEYTYGGQTLVACKVVDEQGVVRIVHLVKDDERRAD